MNISTSTLGWDRGTRTSMKVGKIVAMQKQNLSFQNRASDKGKSGEEAGKLDLTQIEQE